MKAAIKSKNRIYTITYRRWDAASQQWSPDMAGDVLQCSAPCVPGSDVHLIDEEQLDEMIDYLKTDADAEKDATGTECMIDVDYEPADWLFDE